MAKPWTIVGGTGFDLEDIDNPRTREMECPSCKRWVRFVEKDLVKNLKVFGVSVIGVEDPKRVFACPSCNTAIEPPEDAGLSKSDPRIAALERKRAKLEDDEEIWRRRVELAEKRGDDVLANEARSVVERAREEREKIDREIAKLTAWEDERDEKPVVVARVKSGSGALETEGPSLDKAFATLKSKLSGVADAVKSAGESVGESLKGDDDGARRDEPKRSPLLSSSEANEARKREALIEQAAEQEFAALKARLKPGSVAAGSSATGEPSSATGASGGASGEPSSGGEPGDQSRGGGDDFARSAVSSAELGLGMDYVPGPKTAPSAPSTSGGGGGGGAPPPDDDDPVAALKRKLKKPSP